VEPRNGDPARDRRTSALGDAYARALLIGDEVAAEIAIREAMDAELSTAEIDEEIITPALWYVGELWARGEISVADEHLATEISIRVIALQRESQRLARQRRSSRVMLAACAGERHVVALRMVVNLLREAGYEVLMLGADVPARALAAAAERHRPEVICLSATMPGGGDRVLIAMDDVLQAWPSARFVAGGRGLSSRVRERPGLAVCDRVSEAVEVVDAVLKRAELN
jgi:methanogenic corrinoid protein MtbC1